MSMKEIKLVDIVPDPNQPRKFFDETAMQELTDSIREKGVLQPILVRPFDGGELVDSDAYMLVCGERRYRAALAIQVAIHKRDTIPAVIRELTDDEALELQIIENLQRKDVHPLEEAVAFKSLMDHGKDIKEIAARVGKNEFYVRRRMKLNALAKEWQTAFFAGRLQSVDAIQLCTLDEKQQKEIWKERGGGDIGEISIGDWYFNRYRGDLAKAAFPLDDATIDKKMGACDSCQFNSAVASLFPEDVKNPKCTRLNCFKHKADVHFDRALKLAMEDPEIILVNPEYSSYEDNMTRKLEKDGHKILNGRSHNNFDIIEAPEMPQIQDYEPESYDSAAELEKRFKDDVRKYEKELLEFNKKTAGGKYKKGFAICGNNKGHHVFIEFGKPKSAGAGTSAKTKEKEVAGTLTSADIDDEIKRLQEREKRAKELDLQKTHALLLEALKPRKEFETKSFPLQDADRGIMVFLLLNSAGLENDTIKGIPEFEDERHSYNEDYFKKLCKVTDEQLALIIRMVAMDKFGSRNLQYGISAEDTVMRIIGRYLGINIDAIELKQNEVAINRKEKLDKRIAQLKGQRKALEKPAAKAATKAPAKKKIVSTPPPQISQ